MDLICADLSMTHSLETILAMERSPWRFYDRTVFPFHQPANRLNQSLISQLCRGK